MKYKSIALPQPDEGISFKGVKKITVPDQGLSLREILKRFTRGEPVEVGKDPQYDEQANTEESIDYEKLAVADLVDKAEYVERLKQVRRDYEKQEKQRQIKLKAEAMEAAKKEAAEKLKKEKTKESSEEED